MIVDIISVPAAIGLLKMNVVCHNISDSILSLVQAGANAWGIKCLCHGEEEYPVNDVYCLHLYNLQDLIESRKSGGLNADQAILVIYHSPENLGEFPDDGSLDILDFVPITATPEFISDRLHAAITEVRDRFETRKIRLEPFHNVPIGLVRSLPNGQIVRSNKRLAAIYGYESVKEFCSQNSAELYVNPSDRQELIDTLKKHGEVSDFVAKMRRKDGSHFFASMSIKAVKDREGELLFLEGFQRDITNEVKQQQTLRRYQLVFEGYTSQTTDLISRFDAELKYVYANSATARMVGVPAEQMVGKSNEELGVSRSECDFWNANLTEVFRTKKDKKVLFSEGAGESDPSHAYHSILLPEFDDDKNEVATVLVITKNVSEILEKEQQILRERNHLRLALHAAKMTTWELTNDGKLEWSPEAGSILHIPEKQLPARLTCLLRLVHPEDSVRMESFIKKTERYEDQTWITPVEFRLYNETRDKETWLELAAGFMKPHTQSATIKMIGTLRDITSNKQDQFERVALEEQLRQRQKVDCIGAMTSGIAHDFNNLLQVITGFSEIALLDEELSDSTRTQIDEVLTAGTRASELTEQLLFLCRPLETSRRMVELNDLVAEIVRLLRRVVPANISILTEFGVTEPIVVAPVQIQQIVMNLCLNARDSITGSGEIVIVTGMINRDQPCSSKFPEASSGQHAFISVIDSGCGMDAETKSRLYDPFFTTKKDTGEGLGLAVSYSIVRHHRGEIECLSEPGKGTSFTIYIPAGREDGVTGNTKIEDIYPMEKHNGKKATILLVEDDSMVTRFTYAALRKRGYDVYTAENGEVAKKLLNKYGWEVDLVITDMIMPELTGEELYQWIRENKPEIPVLFITGYVEKVERVIFDDPATDILKKPYREAHLTALVGKLLKDVDEGEKKKSDGEEDEGV